MSVRKKVVKTGEEEVTWWIADYFDGSGKRHQQRFPTKKEATAFHDQKKVAIRAGQHVSVPHDLTVDGACKKWLAKADADGLEHGTRVAYSQHVRLHIAPRLGGQKLAKITRGHVEHFRDELLKNLSRPMAKKVFTSFKSMLKANSVGHLADGVTISNAGRHKVRLEPKDIPTPQEVTRILDAATGRWKPLLMTAAFTGLRSSELRGLRWSDVDFDKAEIHVRQRADNWGTIGSPKSEGSRRTVPFGPALAMELKKWKLACPKGEQNLVFPTSTGHVDMPKNLLRSVWPIMVKAHVVDKKGEARFGLHSLRHFFASWCINAKSAGGRELPAKEVQALLGHSSIVMTLDRYGHLFPSKTDRSELAAAEALILAR